MRIANYTPHDINIIDPACTESRPEIRKLVCKGEVKVVKTIPPEGKMLNVQFVEEEGAPVEGVPVVIKRRVEIDPIPEEVDVAIVSGLYAASTNDPRAYTVINPVFDETGRRILGCLAIGKVEF